ncbi:hypothetical protein CASFOL_039903 [Castilleja foliolosa]|uniref:Peptidase A1 domain-containing protein n=1 Tax=Castilleja foliolosa TaxID=1961234 RepID=A0ABD3BGI7_9LAMI
MTTLNCFIHLKMIFMLYSSFLLILISNFLEKSVALQSHFETVESAPECKRFIIDSKEMPKSTFEVFDIYGPCSPAAAGTNPMNMPSPHDILHLDRLRVKALHDRFKPKSTTNKYDSRFQDTKEATRDLPVLFSYGNHAIRIGLGTPPQLQTLMFDTGSDITWSNGFNYYASSSSEIISCDSPACPWYLPHHTCEMFYSENTCFYNTGYLDGSNTKGAFIEDILTIPQTGDWFSFQFGCATEVNGEYDSYTNGILGLGRDNVSFVSQTEDIYNGIFSYCFPSSPSSTGFLKLGPRDYSDNVRFTRLITDPSYPSFYFLNIISISVGGVDLSKNDDQFDLSFPGTVIDTGTVISRLPLYEYIKMRNEFQKQMAYFGYLIIQSPSSLLDTCYYNIVDLIVPTITFTFEGDVNVDMDASTTLYTFVDSKISCLAFAGNNKGELLAVFGNFQQKTLEVVYDVSEGLLGFSPHGCY